MENQPTDSPQKDIPPEEKSFFGVIIHSFFVVPFLIAVFAVLLFTAVRILTMEQRTVYDYIDDVKIGGLTKRWQSAFELSKILANPSLVPQDERFVTELISAFNHAKTDDKRVRQYLALAMGRSGNHKFTTTLISALKDEKEDNLPAVIYALGMLRDKNGSVASIHPFLDHPDTHVRLAAVIALGNIADESSVLFLRKALHDSEPNVQWDAAIGLAKMNDASGRDILINLLDRNYLAKFPEVDLQEQTQIIIVAIQAAKFLNDGELNSVIGQLAKNDTNMNVRAAALK